MYHWMDGWGWFWMSFMMVFWTVLLGAVIYAAVKLGNRPPTDPKATRKQPRVALGADEPGVDDARSAIPHMGITD